jgi:hypothetical protein
MILTEAFADILLADTFTSVAARSMQTVPREGSILAAAVKSLVPKILMRAVYRLSELLGSQFYLRGGAQPLFQKLLRDVQPSSCGHASRVACQSYLLSQMPLTARRSWLKEDAEGLPAQTFQLGRQLPALRFDSLAVTAGGRDSLSRSLITGLTSHPAGADPWEHRLAAAARDYAAELEQLAESGSRLPMAEIGPWAKPAAFDLTTRWAGTLAASACLNAWWHRTGETAQDADPAWVLAALHRLGVHLGKHDASLPCDLAEPLYADLIGRLENGLTFDLDCRSTGA